MFAIVDSPLPETALPTAPPADLPFTKVRDAILKSVTEAFLIEPTIPPALPPSAITVLTFTTTVFSFLTEDVSI